MASQAQQYDFVDYDEGSKRSANINYGPSTFRLPEGWERYEIKEAGPHLFNIIPYVVGEGNPKAEPGKVWYERTYFAHKNFGPSNAFVICPRTTLGHGHRCPRCEELQPLIAKGSKSWTEQEKKVMDDLGNKRRMLLNIEDLDNLTDEIKLKIFETAYYRSFGLMLEQAVDSGKDKRNPDAPSKYRNFFSPTDGWAVELSTRDENYNKRTFQQHALVKFVARQNQYEMSVIDMAACLDDLLVVKPYEELVELMHGGPDEEAIDEVTDTSESASVPADPPRANGRAPTRPAAPARAPAAPPTRPAAATRPTVKPVAAPTEPTAAEVGIELESWVNHAEHGICQVKHISGDGTSLRIHTEAGEEIRGVGVDEVELCDPPEEAPAEEPTKASPKGRAASAAPAKSPPTRPTGPSRATPASRGPAASKTPAKAEPDEPVAEEEVQFDDEVPQSEPPKAPARRPTPTKPRR